MSTFRPAKRGDLVVLVEATSVSYQDRPTEHSDRITVGVVAGVNRDGLITAVLDDLGVKTVVRKTPKAPPRYHLTPVVPQARVDVARCHRDARDRIFADLDAVTAFVRGYLLPEPLDLGL